MQPSEPVMRRAAPTTGLADALMFLLIALVTGYLVAVWAVIRRPILSLPIAAGVGLVLWLGPRVALGLSTCALVICVLWRLAHRSSFERLVWGPLRCSWRRLWVYERRWRSTMILSGLGQALGAA